MCVARSVILPFSVSLWWILISCGGSDAADGGHREPRRADERLMRLPNAAHPPGNRAQSDDDLLAAITLFSVAFCLHI
jgi:hypothetical protein